MNTNFKKICSQILKTLPDRQKEVILRRFGLETGERETLESIGQDFKITRERVRQIENDGLSKIRGNLKPCQKIFEYFAAELGKKGDLKKEEILLSQLGGKNYQPHVFFLLTLGEPFQRFSETDEFHSLWTINPASLNLAKNVIAAFQEKLKEINHPIRIEGYENSARKEVSARNKMLAKINSQVLCSFLEISKVIQQNQDGFYGFRDWPEINPRGVKNKAYIVFKKENRPLHFVDVAKLIGPEALPQTVHNELIKDPRFVLVGRGLYALKEWGYQEGQVKDIILKLLKEAKKPLPKEEILAEVLKQRLVKENTVLLNLNNKEYFLKTPEGKYISRDNLSQHPKYLVQKS